MALERTFAIVKPDALKRGLTAEMISRIHAAKFQIVAIKSLRLTKTEAEAFTPSTGSARFSESSRTS